MGGCEALLTDPAPSSTSISVQFQLDAVPIGGPAEAFARVRWVGVRFVRPDGATRDTAFAALPTDGVIRIPVVLKVEERVDALGIQAVLGFGTSPLFEGSSSVEIRPGEPTSAVIPITPVPGDVLADRRLVDLPVVGATATLSSAVLFASLDTIPGLQGAWTSADPTIVSVTPLGLATRLLPGLTQLEVRFGVFADTVLAGPPPP
jgi:hypothetical protein